VLEHSFRPVYKVLSPFTRDRLSDPTGEGFQDSPKWSESTVPAADAAFQPDVDAPRRSRAFIRDHLDDWGASHCEHEAVLVVSELVTNVVRHAHTEIFLHAEWNAATLRVEVRDGSSVVPAIADLEDEHGRGLRLVQQLTSAWVSSNVTTAKPSGSP